mmetsp:Transcript_25473/g.43440  ORF Transcript_25473/g.43440 Transcript_25473/m.43440 type:complete len:221 (-) Transcript_25473:364-1026(-)
MPPQAREVAGGAAVAESPHGVAAGEGRGVLCSGITVAEPAACAWPPTRGRLPMAALCEQSPLVRMPPARPRPHARSPPPRMRAWSRPPLCATQLQRRNCGHARFSSASLLRVSPCLTCACPQTSSAQMLRPECRARQRLGTRSGPLAAPSSLASPVNFRGPWPHAPPKSAGSSGRSASLCIVIGSGEACPVSAPSLKHCRACQAPKCFDSPRVPCEQSAA